MQYDYVSSSPNILSTILIKCLTCIDKVFSAVFYFWYSVAVSKQKPIDHRDESYFASFACCQLVKVISILFGSQKT
jgi:hypothetical protein